MGNALRNALSKANGDGLVAVINLLGDRRDAGCAGQIAKLAAGAGDAAEPAMAALGKIATPEAVRILSDLHACGKGKRRTAAAHALLQSGQELAARGETAEAKAVYEQLTAGSDRSRLTSAVEHRWHWSGFKNEHRPLMQIRWPIPRTT